MAEAKTALRYAETGKPDIRHENPLAQALLEKLDYDELTNCMRCGFCLPACPTFRETGLEPESPRGRIALMKAVADGLMDPDDAFRRQMDHCLGCRACEPACPAGVKYGHLIEQARDALEDYPKHSFLVSGLRKLLFRHVFPHRKRLKMVGGLLEFYQRSGLRALARGLGIMRLFPKHLREMERILPDSSAKGVVERIGSVHPAKGEKIARVGLFRGCIMDVMFADTNVNTVRLLQEAGFEVVIPESQTCCGALMAHSGEMNQARFLARQNIRAFREAGVDYIVSNAGGCGALLVEYDHVLKDNPEYRESAQWFAERVKDVSELIAEKGRIPEFAAEPPSPGNALRITYQDSCHLRNVMKASGAPRQLMQRVANVDYVELCEADRCCGSAGIYNITQPRMSGKILEHKMEHVHDTRARYLLTSNPGCLLQMKLGIERHRPAEPMEAMHVVDFLYERIKKED